MGYFQSIVGYFGVWWPVILGYLAFQEIPCGYIRKQIEKNSEGDCSVSCPLELAFLVWLG